MNSIKYSIQNNILIIEFLIPSLDLVHISGIKKDLDELFKNNDLKDIIKIYLDLNEVKYIDSSGIGILISVKKMSKTDVHVKNISLPVLEVIKLASLQFMFNIE